MKKIHKRPENDELVGYFNKHLVPVYFTFEKDGCTYHRYFTAFLISISNKWFLITAGHCMNDIDRNLSEGYEIKKSRLIDSGGLNAKHKYPIPFEYVEVPRMHVDVAGLDYGVIYISDFYRAQLEANNVKPLDEEVWEKQPDNPDFYMLIGMPEELTEVDGDNFKIITTLHPIEKIDQKPRDFDETDASMFYGKITLDDTCSDIGGMSGGPIFSFMKNDKGDLRYWLHAVQSKWLRGQQYLAACMMTPFIASLKDEISKIEDKA